MKLFILKMIIGSHRNYSIPLIINELLNYTGEDLKLDMNLAVNYSPTIYPNPSDKNLYFNGIEHVNNFIENLYDTSGFILFEYRLTKPEFCNLFFGKTKIKPYSKKYLIIEDGVISDIATDKLNKLKTFQ